jgi:hypothetical protein
MATLQLQFPGDRIEGHLRDASHKRGLFRVVAEIYCLRICIREQMRLGTPLTGSYFLPVANLFLKNAPHPNERQSF